MRSHLYPIDTSISFHQLHHGALLNIDDFKIINHRLSLEKASHQYMTSSNGPDLIQTNNGAVYVSKCNHFILGTGNSGSGDAWCQLDRIPPIREIHQYKLVETKPLTMTDFNNERNKAASSDDIFLIFTIDESSASWKKEYLPLNSGLINADNAQEYYGPWSGRVFYMCKKLLNLSINSMNREQLMSMPSIGEIRAGTILKKRPFSSLDEAVKKTKISKNFLKQFTFDK